MTGDWIGCALFVLVAAGAVWMLTRLATPPPPISSEEFERRVEEARGTTRSAAIAGMYALQKLMDPRAAESVEVVRDLREGYYYDSKQSGEGDEEEGERVGDEPVARKRDIELESEEDEERDDA